MSEIVTITFSPCIDKSTSVLHLLPEKKLRCTVPKLEPGGGGINVARAIKKLGGEAIAIFPSGGYTGKYFNHLLEKENIPSIIIDSVQETRENIIVLDESTNQQYRFGMPGSELNERECMQCLEALEGIAGLKYIIVSGSQPPGVPLNIYAKLAKISKRKNARLIVDTSGEALRAAAEAGVYLLKPNLGELSFLSGRERIDIDKVVEIARDLIQKNKVEVIVVSIGKDGAMLVTDKENHRVCPPSVEKKSTVGAGDSMLAGIVYSLSKGKNLKEALQYGVASGTAATLHPGTELCSKDDTDRLFKLISEKE